MRRFVLVNLCLVPLGTSAATAQEFGFYGEILGGFTKVDTLTLDFGDLDPIDVATDVGFNVGGALGVSVPLGVLSDQGPVGSIAYGMRLEAQYGYRENNVDDVSFDGFAINSVGTVLSHTGMGNVYLDVGVGAPLTVWVGAGLGLTQVEFDGVEVEDDFAVFLDDADDGVAYQFMGGATLSLTDHAGLSVRYTYLTTDDLGYTTEEDFGAETFKTNYDNHSVSFGLVLRM